MMRLGLEPTIASEAMIEFSEMMWETKVSPPSPTVASIQTEERKRTNYTSYLKMFGYFPGITKWYFLCLLAGSGVPAYGVFSSVNKGINKLIEKVTPADELAINFELFRILNMSASCLVAVINLLASLNEMGKDLGELERFSARRHFIGEELVKLRKEITELKNLVLILIGKTPVQTTALIPAKTNNTSCNKLLQKFGFSPELTTAHYVLLFMLADIAANDTYNTIQKGVKSLLEYLVSAGQIDRDVNFFNIFANVIAAIAACVAMVLAFKGGAKGIVGLQQNTTQITSQAEELACLQRDLEEIRQMLRAFVKPDAIVSPSSPVAFFDRQTQFIAQRLQVMSVEISESLQEPKSKKCNNLFSKCSFNSGLSWKSFLCFINMGATAYETFDSSENVVLLAEEFIVGVIDYLLSSDELTRNYELLSVISTIMACMAVAYIMTWTLKFVSQGLQNLKTDSAIITLHGEVLESIQSEKEDIESKVQLYQAQQMGADEKKSSSYSPLFNFFGNPLEIVVTTGENLLNLSATLPSRGLTFSSNSEQN